MGTRENVNLDFKAEYGGDSFEVAKDVAALANAQGGTILVGAAGGDRVQRYLPQDAEASKRTARLVEEAVRNRCRPSPLLSVAEISLEDGYVLGINVWPFPGQPVGVNFTKGEVSAGSKASQVDDACYFPMRMATQTKTIGAAQLPLFMDAGARRAAIVLDGAEGHEVMVFMPLEDKSTHIHTQPAVVGAIDAYRNVVRLDYEGQGGQPIRTFVPLDHVSALRTEDGWQLFIRGWLKSAKILDRQGSKALGALTGFFLPQ